MRDPRGWLALHAEEALNSALRFAATPYQILAPAARVVLPKKRRDPRRSQSAAATRLRLRERLAELRFHLAKLPRPFVRALLLPTLG